MRHFFPLLLLLRPFIQRDFLSFFIFLFVAHLKSNVNDPGRTGHEADSLRGLQQEEARDLDL